MYSLRDNGLVGQPHARALALPAFAPRARVRSGEDRPSSSPLANCQPSLKILFVTSPDLSLPPPSQLCVPRLPDVQGARAGQARERPRLDGVLVRGLAHQGSSRGWVGRGNATPQLSPRSIQRRGPEGPLLECLPPRRREGAASASPASPPSSRFCAGLGGGLAGSVATTPTRVSGRPAVPPSSLKAGGRP